MCVLGWGSFLFLGDNLQGVMEQFFVVAAPRQGDLPKEGNNL